MGLWHQQMGQRYERLQDALSPKMAFPPTAHAFIGDEQQRAWPFLSRWGPSILPLLNHQQDSVALLLDFKHEHVESCQEFQIRNSPCSHALVTVDVGGKQVANYIPHHHTLTCWQDTKSIHVLFSLSLTSLFIYFFGRLSYFFFTVYLVTVMPALHYMRTLQELK